MNETVQDALDKLGGLGFRFQVNGAGFTWQWQGQERPAPDQVQPLMGLLKTNDKAVKDLLLAQGKEVVPSCALCSWYALNPWSHYPDLGAWCHHHMDHLLVDNPQCRDYRQGKVPPRPDQVEPQTQEEQDNHGKTPQ